MNKKQMLGALLMIGMLAPSGMYAMDDGSDSESSGHRIHLDGGNGPWWSYAEFRIIDTVCGVVNAPLDTALQKITAWGAKSKLLVTGLFGYLAYRAKDKIVEDVQNAPELISQNASQLMARFAGNTDRKKNEVVHVVRPTCMRGDEDNSAEELQNEEKEPEVAQQVAVPEPEVAAQPEVVAVVEKEVEVDTPEPQVIQIASNESDTEQEDETDDAESVETAPEEEVVVKRFVKDFVDDEQMLDD